MPFDLSVLLTPEGLISLVTLIFLEILLGVDNIVFIVLTSSKLPENLQALGRKLGLLGAMVMRCLFLCFASYLIHMVDPLFTINLGFYNHGFAIRDIVLFLGGAYLIYKGFTELHKTFSLVEEKEEGETDSSDSKSKSNARKTISLPQAVGTIMIMDIVFSIDSVITAVGMANHLIIMILAVVIAIIIMVTFIGFIANFINAHVELEILALIFIATIGVLLAFDGAGIVSSVEILDMHLEKLLVYFGMLFSFAIELIQIRYRTKRAAVEKKNSNK